MYRLGVASCRKEKLQHAPVAVRKVVCGMCSRSFRRESDRRGINVLMRRESWFRSKRVLFNACYVKGGLEVKEGGMSTDAYQRDERRLLFQTHCPYGEA